MTRKQLNWCRIFPAHQIAKQSQRCRFLSTHPFHVLMDGILNVWGQRNWSLQFETKWFYERARGQYLQSQMRLTPAKKNSFCCNIQRTNLLQNRPCKFRNTWDGLPHIVSKGAQANFTEFAQKISDAWKGRYLIFTEKYYQESVAMCLLFRYTESMIPHQPWYQQGYRANIVTYTIALFHKLIKTQFPKRDLDLSGIWTRQTIPPPVQKVLVELSELVYDKLTDPSRDVENVTQWCKREGCWNSVQTIQYTLGSDIEDCLVTQDEIRTAVRSKIRQCFERCGCYDQGREISTEVARYYGICYKQADGYT